MVITFLHQHNSERNPGIKNWVALFFVYKRILEPILYFTSLILHSLEPNPTPCLYAHSIDISL